MDEQEYFEQFSGTTVFDMHIRDLGLSNRTRNLLLRANNIPEYSGIPFPLYTANDLVSLLALDENTVLRIRGLGVAALQEIKDALKSIGWEENN